MLAKSERIPREAIASMRRARGPRGESRRVNTGLFSLVFQENQEKRNRFAFFVGAKVARHAVTRNGLRRSMASRVRKLPSAGLDILVITHPPAGHTAKEELGAALESEVKKIIFSTTPQ